MFHPTQVADKHSNMTPCTVIMVQSTAMLSQHAALFLHLVDKVDKPNVYKEGLMPSFNNTVFPLYSSVS